jgi:nicotinamidase-related amidase
MTSPNPDLHGNAPDKCRVALLVIDTINDFEWSGGEKIIREATAMARNILRLKDRAKKAGVPVVYVNDNFGRWKSDFKAVVDHVIEDDTTGRPVAELLKPSNDDYFVLKPKHSGFYSTTLDILLEYLGTETVILTGLQTNICVLFTANEAYMRDFHIVVAPDCCISEDKDHHEYAIDQMQRILKAEITNSDDIDFDRIHRAPSDARD